VGGPHFWCVTQVRGLNGIAYAYKYKLVVQEEAKKLEMKDESERDTVSLCRLTRLCHDTLRRKSLVRAVSQLQSM